MPEPEAAAEVVVPPTPPIESASSRASFASCPPEEDREVRARRARSSIDDDNDDDDESARENAVEDGDERDREGDVRIRDRDRDRDVRQEPTPEPEVEMGAQQRVEREKGEHVEDVEVGSVVASPEGREREREQMEGGDVRMEAETDGRLGAAGEDGESGPLYLSYPSTRREKQHPQAWSSFLHPGSKFRGTQQSDRQVYDVQVEIKDVDLTDSRLCGYLRIQGLTDDHPTLTTFFEGEIIGPKHLFRTTHPSWNSSEKIDLQHWARFPPFRPLAKSARASPSTFTLKNYLDREHLFMRWKEYFLVPDHRVKSISGASFEGFYYICFDQVGGSVSGIYFHAKSEKYQQLDLRHVGSGGCVGSVEFR